MHMNHVHKLPINLYLSCLAVIMVLLITGCDRQPSPPLQAIKPGETKHFTGTWSATGTRQIMQLEPGNEAIIFKISGSMLLAGKERLNKGFKAEAIGFYDARSGLHGRSVWTDQRGDKVFSELRADSGGAGSVIEGTFFGGTGRYAAIHGDYTFKWKRLVHTENRKMSGRSVDLKGWVGIGKAGTTSPITGGQE